MTSAKTDSPARDRQPLNWRNILFLVISPIAALAGLVWWLASGNFHFATILLAVAMAFATGLGITAGYHRLFSHRAFEAPWPVRLFLALFGGASFEGSVWEWCVDHRDHHRYVDGDDDPYSIRKGFWYAHMLWLFHAAPSRQSQRRAPDLWSDPIVRFQHRFYVILAVVVSFALPMGIAALWGDPWGGLWIAGAVRLVLNQHFTFAINSVCHTFGTQTYSDRHSARDHWFTALFTYGEGYHNYHHEFPADYRNGIRAFDFDPTKWLISVLAAIGMAKNLRRMPPEVFLMRKCALQEKRLSEKLTGQPTALVEFAQELLSVARTRLDESAERLRGVRRTYEQLRRESLDRRNENLRALRSQVRQLTREFRSTVALWESVTTRLQDLIATAGPQPSVDRSLHAGTAA